MRGSIAEQRPVFSALLCAVLALACITPVMAQTAVRFEAESFSGMSPVTDATCVGGAYTWYGASEVTLDMPASGTWYVWVRYDSSSSRLLDVTVNGTVTRMPTTSGAVKWKLAGNTTGQQISVTLQGASASPTKVDSLIFTSDSGYNPATSTLTDWNALPVLTPVVQVPPVRVEVENLLGLGGIEVSASSLGGESAWIGYAVYGGSGGKVTLPEGATTWYAWVSYYANNVERDLDVTLNGATTYLHDMYNLWGWQRAGAVNQRDVDINLVSSDSQWSAADSIIFTPSPTYDPNNRSFAELSALTEIPRNKEFAEQWLTDNPAATTAAWVEAVRSHYGYPLVSRVPPIDSYGNITYQGTPVFPLLLFSRDTAGTALNATFGWPDATWPCYGVENFHYAWRDYDHWAKNYNRPVNPMGGRAKAIINYIVDEPEGVGVSDVECERLNDLVNMMDPNVATLINVSPSYAARGSVLTIPDVVSLDRYPIDHYSQTISENALFFDSLRYYSDIRPAIFIAQSFQWESTLRYPTPAEERAMSYLALAHNARGLMWFQWPATGGGTIETADPVLWADMKVLFGEIAQIIPCLQGPEIIEPYTATVTNPIGGTGAEFRVAVSADRSQAVLIAVNPYQGGDWPHTVRLDFRSGPLTDAFLTSRFAGQSASVTQVIPGVWEVTFASAPASGVFTLASSHLGELTQMTKAQVKDVLGVRLNADTPPERLQYCMCSHTVNVPSGASWTTTFGSSVNEFRNSVYAVGGGSGDNIACVYWQPGNVQLCEYNWQYGSVFWKFHTDNPSGFAGGKISLTFSYTSSQSGRTRGFAGVSTSAPTVNLTYGTVTWSPSSSVNIWGDYPGSDGYGTLTRTVTLDIPAGQDFYFGVQCGWYGTSDIVNLKSITIQPSPVQVSYGNYGNTIVVPQHGIWSTAFGNTAAEFTNTLYAVGGGNSAMTKGPVHWKGFGNVQLCEYNSKYGSVFWKVHTDAPGGFTKGIATLNFDYDTAVAGRDRGYVGVGSSPPLPVNPGWAWGGVNWDPPTRETIWGSAQGNGGVMNTTVTLPLPPGSDAYIGVNTRYGDDGDVIWLRWLQVADSISIDEVKQCQNGTIVSVANAVVSASFDGYFYIESDDRSSAIRVNKSGYTIPTPCRVTVSGTVATANGERCINANTVTPVAGSGF